MKSVNAVLRHPFLLPPEPADRSTGRGVLAAAIAASLGGIGALHVAWGLGSTWPTGDPESLARTVVGSPSLEQPPGAVACLTVAGALGIAAAAPLARFSGDARVRRAGHVLTRGAAVVLAARGTGGLVQSGLFPARVTPEFRAMDLAVYSPFCLALAAGMIGIGRKAAPRGRSGAPAT